MGIGKSLKNGVSSGFRVKRWLGVDTIKNNGLFIVRIFKGIFNARKTAPIHENFDQAMVRMNLTDADLAKRVRSGRYLVWFCLGLAMALAVYMVCLFYGGQIVAGSMCFMLMLTMMVYAYREHFNIFQIKQRRLGCTYREWFKYIFHKGSK